MEARINSFINGPRGISLITLFGYTTKGVPGIEIHGMSKVAKVLREKIIYLTKIRELSVPKRRYVVCLDINELSTNENWKELKSLELAAILLYWYLAGLIPISKLDDCLCQGHINTRGEIYQRSYDVETIKALKEQLGAKAFKQLKVIGSDQDGCFDFLQIQTRDLLEHIPDITCFLDG